MSKKIILSIMLLGLASILSACERDGPAEELGESIDEAAEEIKEDAQQAKENVEDAVKK